VFHPSKTAQPVLILPFPDVERFFFFPAREDQLLPSRWSTFPSPFGYTSPGPKTWSSFSPCSRNTRSFGKIRLTAHKGFHSKTRKWPYLPLNSLLSSFIMQTSPSFATVEVSRPFFHPVPNVVLLQRPFVAPGRDGTIKKLPTPDSLLFATLLGDFGLLLQVAILTLVKTIAFFGTRPAPFFIDFLFSFCEENPSWF